MFTDEMRRTDQTVSLGAFTEEELKVRERLLVDAFEDEEFQDTLKSVRQEIEDELKIFLKALSERYEFTQKIYDNVESRVKGAVSFKDKIYRKDYVYTWNITDDIASNQSLIATTLPDLIGFRITCFFWQDEERIYELMEQYADDGGFANMALDFEEPTEQANGHKIYKVTGLYTDESDGTRRQYGFEVQIKGIMHNIWGEVEHKTIYKDEDFDPFTETKKSITEEIFHALHASNNQLLTLYSRKNDENLLTYALFYERTKDLIREQVNSSILGSHYRAFLRVFESEELIAHVRKLVGNWLLDQPCPKLAVTVEYEDARVDALAADIEKEFYRYNLNCLYLVAGLVYDIADYQTFLRFLANHLLHEEEEKARAAVRDDRENVYEWIEADYRSGFSDDENDNEFYTAVRVPDPDGLKWNDEILSSLDDDIRAWKKKYRSEYKRKQKLQESRKNDEIRQPDDAVWKDWNQIDLTRKLERWEGDTW